MNQTTPTHVIAKIPSLRGSEAISNGPGRLHEGIVVKALNIASARYREASR